MLCVALSDVLNQRAVIRQIIRCDVDSLGVPDFAVLKTEFIWVEDREETQLCADTKVGNNNVENFVEQLIFRDFLDQILSDRLSLFQVCHAVVLPTFFRSLLLADEV